MTVEPWMDGIVPNCKRRHREFPYTDVFKFKSFPTRQVLHTLTTTGCVFSNTNSFIGFIACYRGTFSDVDSNQCPQHVDCLLSFVE
jgi:hypothetical protein